MNVQRLIRAKRLGHPLSDSDIAELIRAYMGGQVEDYHMAALLMAIVWRGMSDAETLALTRAMIDSGDTLSWEDVSPTADKHSTGGVGDKVSIALAPLVASAGVRVPMLSGRGLGHTGGTLDKLGAIPGLETELDSDRFGRILRDVGFVMGGQSGDLAPADGRLYALRDATETVESLPLIVSSIISKKVAAGPETLVLDVKVGRGAFIQDIDRARELATLLVATGRKLGVRVVAFLTDMDVPLGRAVGNAVETNEAVDMLRGRTVPDDFRELTLVLSAAMLVGAGVEQSLAAARDRLETCLSTGAARDVFARMVAAQGGDPIATIADDLPLGRAVVVPAPRGGVVSDIGPREIAGVVSDLGGGRRRVTDTIDPAVGVYLNRRPGEDVQVGETLATLYVSHAPGDDQIWIDRVASAYSFGAARRSPLIIDVVGADGCETWRGWDTPVAF